MFSGKTIVGERGQVVIPKAVRDLLNIKKKDKLIVIVKNNRLYLEKNTYEKLDRQNIMAKSFRERSKELIKFNKDWEFVDSEVNDSLGDY